jgi:uncharacterized protein involved in oxidation of intracellular sulfur
MKYLFILNDPPYGTERNYNALRLAASLAKDQATKITVFLIGDAVGCAVADQSTPAGHYNLERMLGGLISKGMTVAVCGTCIDARGIKAESLVQGARRSSMEELTAWTQEADKAMVF